MITFSYSAEDIAAFERAIESIAGGTVNAQLLSETVGDVRVGRNFLLAILKSCANDSEAFPRYLLLTGEGDTLDFVFAPLGKAGAIYDSSYQKAALGDLVLEEGLKLRRMTDEDKRAISNAADECSARK